MTVVTESITQARASRPPTRQATVTGTELLTPHMRRITFEGDGLAALRIALPAQWLKVVLPGPEEGLHNRAYTIRRHYPGWCALDIDFVLHGDGGAASAWARRAAVGQVVQLGEARGGHRIDSGAQWRLLAGDETALPAIASILDALPADDVPTRVVLEVPGLDDRQPLRGTAASEFHWIARGRSSRPGAALADTVCSLSLSDQAGQVFLAGEASAVRRMRQDLAGRAPQASLDAKGYWLLGEADHRDGG